MLRFTVFFTSLFAFAAFAQHSQPNVVFIFADDMSYETIGAHGLLDIDTPNLDRLVESGASFTHAYNMGAWGGAVCTASRTMLNSGAFVNRAQTVLKSQLKWGELMQQAGYRTYMTGKWHVPGLSPEQGGFDVVRDPRGGMPKQTPEGYNRPLSPEDYASGWKPWDQSKGGFWQGGTHWSEVVGNHSVDFINEAKEGDAPFFMYLAFNATHDPRQAPKEFIDMYPLERVELPENYLPNYPYDSEIGCDPKKLRDARLMPSPRSEYAVKVNRQEYFAIVTHMDVEIGRILDALEASGLADNTYVIFTADHGLAVGRHGLVGKQNMYEHSMRVPFMISGPGVEAGSSFSMPIYLQDAMATALEIGAVEKPEHVEFKSVLPLIRGESSVQYEQIYGKYKDHQRMILAGDYKLIAYPDIGVVRLYHTAKDPLEMHDLAGNPEYTEVIARLKRELSELQQDMGDPLVID